MQNAQKRQQIQMETTLNDITTQCHICRTNKQTKHRRLMLVQLQMSLHFNTGHNPQTRKTSSSFRIQSANGRNGCLSVLKDC